VFHEYNTYRTVVMFITNRVVVVVVAVMFLWKKPWTVFLHVLQLTVMCLVL